MSSGKETPRQKMIGMMYLVLTALLALNVSKQILQGFVMVNESVSKSKLILDENNFKVKKAFEDYVNAGNYEAKPYLLKAIEAQKSIRIVDAYIDSVKLLIIQKSEGPTKTDTSQLRFMERLDDFDTPTHMMIGSDESNPISSKYSAKDLKLQLTKLYSDLTLMLDHMQKNASTKLERDDVNAIKQKLSSIKPLDNNSGEDGEKLNWELKNFYHMPMAAVITNLNKIQADMKNLESEFLHVFGAASNKYLFKVNKLQAKVVAPSAYVLTGQSFKADVVLSASSTELTSDRMKVLVGATYDSITKKLSVAGNSLTISDGIGKYETVTSSIGSKDLKGVVVYKNPKGIDEYYPFDFSYMVAPPFTAIAADNMNVFYVGVENPISVSSAGFAPSDLKVSVSGCGALMQANAGGKYTLKATSAGTCMVTVMAKVNGVYKPQGEPKKFRVKSIPPPVLKVGGKLALGNLEFTRAGLQSIAGLAVESPGFDFPVSMIVKSFDLTYYKSGELKTITCNTSNLSNDAKRALTELRIGQRAYFENVKVQTPAGVISVPMAQIKVKS
jgi:gliding motility-associated protein GldM